MRVEIIIVMSYDIGSRDSCSATLPLATLVGADPAPLLLLIFLKPGTTASYCYIECNKYISLARAYDCALCVLIIKLNTGWLKGFP